MHEIVTSRGRQAIIVFKLMLKIGKLNSKGSFTIVNIYVLVQRVLGGRGVRGQRTIFKMLINLWNIL